MKEKLNLEEEANKRYSSKPLSNKKSKTLYVINFTSRRIALFFVSCVSLIIFIFSIGFYLGNAKQGAPNEDALMPILLREDATTMRSLAVPSGAEELSRNIETPPQNSSIIDMTTLSQPGNDSVIERTDLSSYNEYTSDLANEFNSINSSIKKGTDSTPNSSYTPPEQKSYVLPDAPIAKENLYPRPDPTPPVQFGTSTTKVTKVPYGASSSDNDIIYFIQVAVGNNEKFSYAARDKLKPSFPKAFIAEETAQNGSIMYKLKIGRYETRSEAEVALESIKKNPEYRGSYIYTDKRD